MFLQMYSYNLHTYAQSLFCIEYLLDHQNVSLAMIFLENRAE